MNFLVLVTLAIATLTGAAPVAEPRFGATAPELLEGRTCIPGKLGKYICWIPTSDVLEQLVNEIMLGNNDQFLILYQTSTLENLGSRLLRLDPGLEKCPREVGSGSGGTDPTSQITTDSSSPPGIRSPVPPAAEELSGLSRGHHVAIKNLAGKSIPPSKSCENEKGIGYRDNIYLAKFLEGVYARYLAHPDVYTIIDPRESIGMSKIEAETREAAEARNHLGIVVSAKPLEINSVDRKAKYSIGVNSRLIWFNRFLTGGLKTLNSAFELMHPWLRLGVSSQLFPLGAGIVAW
ncbi:hypothetical protein JAAARDRAFT_51215 [Jaapia argillacea MUCL 33604]|uniref:Uncharacterized protein n=1 Tax=Jaapia argillacea MUCL 33604 TaxID=933084 RepID=A0A067P764_9AGAM|nr:hypothetical protein JAAARDRAFT_51215 [Jaapia argillacea MUCL 33604]